MIYIIILGGSIWLINVSELKNIKEGIKLWEDY